MNRRGHDPLTASSRIFWPALCFLPPWGAAVAEGGLRVVPRGCRLHPWLAAQWQPALSFGGQETWLLKRACAESNPLIPNHAQLHPVFLVEVDGMLLMIAHQAGEEHLGLVFNL